MQRGDSAGGNRRVTWRSVPQPVLPSHQHRCGSASSLTSRAISYACVQVSTVQRFRKGLPEGATVFVAKNNLMKVAVDQTEGWSTLKEKGCAVRQLTRWFIGGVLERMRRPCDYVAAWRLHGMVSLTEP